MTLVPSRLPWCRELEISGSKVPVKPALRYWGPIAASGSAVKRTHLTEDLMTREAALRWSVLAPRTVKVLSLLVLAAGLAALLFSVLWPELGAPEMAPTRWSRRISIG